MLWRDELPAEAALPITSVKAKDRIRVVKLRNSAQAVLRELFPDDEVADG